MRQEGDMGNTELDFTIERLGECHIPSPVKGIRFVDDEGRCPLSLSSPGDEAMARRRNSSACDGRSGAKGKNLF
jgi:hypothetical protein